jgi:hypothetical protein
MCTRTKRVEHASEDLEYLRAMSRQPATFGKLQGRVRRIEWLETGKLEEPVGQARVIAVSQEPQRRRYETRTLADGSYAIPATPGTYAVSAEARPGLYVDRPDQIVELKDARGCAVAEFALHADGRINGRVIDFRGEPVAFIAVGAIQESSLQGRYFWADRTVITDESGRFELSRLRPDTYQLGLDIRKNDKRSAEDIIWFVTEPDRSPERVAVAAEARVGVADFRLPASIELARLSGTVVDAAGKPVASARVMTDASLLDQPHLTDANGRFRLTVLARRQYRLVAYYSEESRRPGTTQSPTFVASSDLPPFKLTFDK